LQSNGIVLAWGNNFYNQTNVPPGLTNAIAIAAGFWHNLALREDHTATNWGKWTDAGAHTVSLPASWTNLTRISAGQQRDLGLKADGTILAWGYDTNQGFCT